MISNSSKDKVNISDSNLLNEESLDWCDESEIEILSFYVSFLLIYCLYLKEKNFMVKKNG